MNLCTFMCECAQELIARIRKLGILASILFFVCTVEPAPYQDGMGPVDKSNSLFHVRVFGSLPY